jgi:hypothetical protein
MGALKRYLEDLYHGGNADGAESTDTPEASADDDDEEEEDIEDRITRPTSNKATFMARADIAARHAAYLGRKDKDIRAAVRKVADAWTRLAKQMGAAKQRKVAGGNGAEPEASAEAMKQQFTELAEVDEHAAATSPGGNEDGLDIPELLRRGASTS